MAQWLRRLLQQRCTAGLVVRISPAGISFSKFAINKFTCLSLCTSLDARARVPTQANMAAASYGPIHKMKKEGPSFN